MADKFACTHCGFVFEDPDMEVCPRCGTELGQEWDPAELRSFVITELTEEQAGFVATLTTFDADEILAVFKSDGCFALQNLTPRQVEAYAEFLKQEGIPFVAESEEQKAIRLQKQLEAHTASQNAKAAQAQAKANADAKAAAQANAQAENDAKIKAEELARAQMADAEKTKLSSAAQIEADRLRQLELEKIKIETEAKAKIAIAEANAREAEAKLGLKKLEHSEKRKTYYWDWIKFLFRKISKKESDGYSLSVYMISGCSIVSCILNLILQRAGMIPVSYVVAALLCGLSFCIIFLFCASKISMRGCRWIWIICMCILSCVLVGIGDFRLLACALTSSVAFSVLGMCFSSNLREFILVQNLEKNRKAEIPLFQNFMKYDLDQTHSLELVLCPSGTFLHGLITYDEVDDRIFQDAAVTIPKPFLMGKFQVTQEQYQCVMGKNPSYFLSPDRPVEQVSWKDAMAFCDKLNEITKGKRPEGYDFTLPTSFQWEYACRAGTISDLDNYGNLVIGVAGDQAGWFDENSGKDFQCSKYGQLIAEFEEDVKKIKKGTHPVGQKTPNAWGLYDMYGNVREWFLEKTHEDGKDYRISSGCSWRDQFLLPAHSFNTYKYDDADETAADEIQICDTGFRVVLSPAEKGSVQNVQDGSPQQLTKVSLVLSVIIPVGFLLVSSITGLLFCDHKIISWWWMLAFVGFPLILSFSMIAITSPFVDMKE